MAERDLVLIVGAGGSLADGVSRPEAARPPLDRGFFRGAFKDPSTRDDVHLIASYLRDKYAIEDVRAPNVDSLEEVMVRIYSDIFDPTLGREAYPQFLRLLRVFNRRLAETTNEIPMTPRKLLYRVVRRLVENAGHTSRLTIVTFNQDLQLEKALYELHERMPQRLGVCFSFPSLYDLGTVTVTRPDSAPTFGEGGQSFGCISLLKLHGSLNWYRTHRSANPERRALFRADRRFEITPRSTIPSQFMRRRKTKRVSTFPVVVPPVNHKSAILPDMLRPVWREAEDRLASATHVTVFGYSCPPADFESANMISRSFGRNSLCEELAIIDPDPATVPRFAMLTRMERITYFRTASSFLWQD